MVLTGFGQQDANPKNMELISTEEGYGETQRILKSITKWTEKPWTNLKLHHWAEIKSKEIAFLIEMFTKTKKG